MTIHKGIYIVGILSYFYSGLNAAAVSWKNNADFSNLNIVKEGWNRIILDKDPAGGSAKVIKTVYPKGSFPLAHDGKGGLGFYANPVKLDDKTTITFGYKVFFPTDFTWVKGGKLPGLYSGFGASGGNHDNGFSYRLMWRAAAASEAYLYVPAYPEYQDASYGKLPGLVLDPSYGDSVARGVSKFVAGKWNIVELSLKLNTIAGKTSAKKNGVAKLTVNGKVSLNFNKIVWRKSATDTVKGIMFQTFFGGHNASFAPSSQQVAYFKDLYINAQ